MIGAMIDEGLYRLGKQQIWKQPGGQSLGGHALVLVGYDDHKQAYKVLNSWGPKWASQGYGWISYAHFAKVVREGYVAKDALTDPWPTLSKVTDVAPGVAGAAPAPESPAKPAPPRQPAVVGNTEQSPDDKRDKPDKPSTSDSTSDRAADNTTGSSAAEDEKKELRERGNAPDPEASQPLDGIVNGRLDDLDDFNNIDPPMQMEEEVVPPIEITSARLLGDQLLFSGKWDLGPQAGKQMQVVIQLYRDPHVQVPLTTETPRYALANGQAVAVSITLPVDDQAEWLANIPYALVTQQLNLKTRAKVNLGLIELWAQPVLYLDRFGVERGPLQRIQLKPGPSQ